MLRSFRVLTALLVATAVIAAVKPAVAQSAGADVQRSLAEVRRATARYHSVEVAVSDGFVGPAPCAPGKGVHYSHPGRMANPAIDATEPEVLVYEPRSNGKLRLVAIEWLAFDPDQNLTTVAGRPSLFGVPFDGPMLGHGPGMPIHFDLHAWLWKHNPSGVFTADNPNATC
jgi:hypothetical protein